MTAEKLLFRPGVNVQLSQTLNKGGFSGSNLIRFFQQLPQKLGGWQRLTARTIMGSARAMHAWADLDGDKYIAIGTEQALEIYDGKTIRNITPIRRTSDLTTPLTTTAGSSIVQVADTGSATRAGDAVRFFIQTAIDGLILFGDYVITAVLDANTYQFDGRALAVAGVTGGGTVPAFTTTLGSTTVTVVLAAHGRNAGDVFNVPVATAVGGLTISGLYLVASVVDPDTFTITASVTASAGATVSENAGNVRILYYIAAGMADNAYLSGWGIGTWGAGPWGGGVGGQVVFVPLRSWSLDNFGQTLMAVPTLGPLYQWTPDPQPEPTNASLVSAAPSVNGAMFVAMPEAQVVLLGSSVGGVQDPLLVAWSEAGDYTSWTASVTNQAGTLRLSRGSAIIGGLQAPQMAFIWTDVGVWTMHYVGPPFIYSFEEIGTGCGLLALHAATTLAEQIYWVSQRSFFVLDGSGLRSLPCTVWDFFFTNLHKQQATKTFLAPNSNFNELTCFFPSMNGGGEIDSYVKYSLDGPWDFGNLVRLAWIDQSVWGPPIGIDGPNGLLQQHETGPDADGQPMTGVEVLTGFADVGNGEDFIFIQRLLPDFKWTGSANGDAKKVTVTFYLADYPSDAEPEGLGVGVVGPLTVTSATQYISVMARARQVAMKIESDISGVQWRLGAFRYIGTADGRF